MEAAKRTGPPASLRREPLVDSVVLPPPPGSAAPFPLTPEKPPCYTPASQRVHFRAPTRPARKVASMPGKKIMAVDDERHIVRLIQVNLERSGFQVVTAFDGPDALKKVESDRPDLIVLDVMMPRMDGFEVLKRLQANPETREIPIIMLTAKAQDADVFRGWASGVSAYLTKPFNPLELITFVKRILSGRDDYDDGEKVWEV